MSAISGVSASLDPSTASNAAQPSEEPAQAAASQPPSDAQSESGGGNASVATQFDASSGAGQDSGIQVDPNALAQAVAQAGLGSALG